MSQRQWPDKQGSLQFQNAPCFCLFISGHFTVVILACVSLMLTDVALSCMDALLKESIHVTPACLLNILFSPPLPQIVQLHLRSLLWCQYISTLIWSIFSQWFYHNNCCCLFNCFMSLIQLLCPLILQVQDTAKVVLIPKKYHYFHLITQSSHRSSFGV